MALIDSITYCEVFTIHQELGFIFGTTKRAIEEMVQRLLLPKPGNRTTEIPHLLC
jgi:hypothetical protein